MFSHRTVVTTIIAGLSFLLAALLGGCADTMRNEQLARVAKDWSQVIRASQVVPVYPLTEDLVPGDIFLVTMSIPQQHREYQKRGFLPMDMHLGRLSGLDYKTVYEESHGTKDKDNTPYHWIFANDGIAPQTIEDLHASEGEIDERVNGDRDPNDPNKPQRRRHTDSTLWPTAPRASFPSYTFTVDSRGGIKAALPIQGIPVALSLMRTDKAFVSATLHDAYTYGVPYDRLIDSVKEWAEDESNRQLLQQIRKGVSKGNTWFSKLDDCKKWITLDRNERTVYLRVISRVYVVGAVSVAIVNTQKGAADTQIGAAREISLLNPASLPGLNKSNPEDDPSKAVSDFQKTLDAINANVGAGVRVQWATARSVALDETFARPLAVGYLGFDFPVDNNGNLLPPVATQRQIEGASPITVSKDKDKVKDLVARWSRHEDNKASLENWKKKESIDKPVEQWPLEQLDSAVRELNIPEKKAP